MYKIITIVGTRPEIIRLSLIIPKLDLYTNHILIHTGQNYDRNLTDIFFDQLSLRRPDYYLNIDTKSFGIQLSNIFSKLEAIIDTEQPDGVLILGDVNSGLSSILFSRKKIKIFHMEAGNRCFDNRVPEELNRHLIDKASTYNLTYTLNSKLNLLQEGYDESKVFVSGNPIGEVIKYYQKQIEDSDIHNKLNINNKYSLITLHRSETVDNLETLTEIFEGLNKIIEHQNLKIIFPMHPRTLSKYQMIKEKIIVDTNILIIEPIGFFDFIKLQKTCRIYYDR
jgi:UDP-N-acetylglucosamine 2-epimerase (non-hydrolysing)